jgi:hypothetical protein
MAARIADEKTAREDCGHPARLVGNCVDGSNPERRTGMPEEETRDRSSAEEVDEGGDDVEAHRFEWSRDSAGRDSAGRDSAGRDSAGRDSAGRDSASRDSSS